MVAQEQAIKFDSGSLFNNQHYDIRCAKSGLSVALYKLCQPQQRKQTVQSDG